MEHWSVWVYPITTSVTAFLVQMFFIYRCYLLIPDKTNGRILTLLVFLTVVVALLSAISARVIGHAHQEYSQRSAATVPSLIWIVSTACADILIAVTLVWHLRAMQIGLTSHETRNAVFRLTRTAIQTGSITAFLAAVVIVLFLSDKGSNAHVGVGYCLGRCYTLSLLMNLNGRPMLRDCDTVDLGQSELGTTTTTITGEGTRRRSRSRSLMLESPRVEVGTVGMGIDTSARAKAPQDQV
ncbi:hypothetical protein FB45DRAFT_235376 [Roridomyces roridus]|uniref:DUF6534 domain-containing protein n=1 Tax=Roridomyces roridus TaxID=1738132 RepID=A0AAD7BBM1_9AGAR|nr:hypothetical protein FB45DRAFT_235376 [Roridomyces roridus]